MKHVKQFIAWSLFIFASINILGRSVEFGIMLRENKNLPEMNFAFDPSKFVEIAVFMVLSVLFLMLWYAWKDAE